jgi:hypothetical protein
MKTIAQASARLQPISANLFCYKMSRPAFRGAWMIPKGCAPIAANRPSPLPDSIEVQRRVGFDGE